MALPTLPTKTATIDDQFVESWYDIRAEAVDNILDATVFWLALREMGSLTPQSGGTHITRTIKYGKKTGQNLSKGKVLSQSVAKRETMALWNWAYTIIDVNRSLIDDQINSGPTKIKDYVAKRLNGANEDLIQKLEDDLFAWAAAADSQMNGLMDIVPVGTVSSTTGLPNLDITPTGDAPTHDAGNFGNISRTNSWWQIVRRKVSGTDTAASSPEVNLLSDMDDFYNQVGNNVQSPNFMICDRVLYQYYMEEASDRIQMVRTAFNNLAADLGFESATFRGKPISWSSKLDSTSKMFFLNLDFIEVVYDPGYFFDATEWMYTANQLERVMYIYSTMQLITDQPRRHGMLDYNSTTKDAS
jgi:hypothetical protein